MLNDTCATTVAPMPIAVAREETEMA